MGSPINNNIVSIRWATITIAFHVFVLEGGVGGLGRIFRKNEMIFFLFYVIPQ